MIDVYLSYRIRYNFDEAPYLMSLSRHGRGRWPNLYRNSRRLFLHGEHVFQPMGFRCVLFMCPSIFPFFRPTTAHTCIYIYISYNKKLQMFVRPFTLRDDKRGSQCPSPSTLTLFLRPPWWWSCKTFPPRERAKFLGADGKLQTRMEGGF